MMTYLTNAALRAANDDDVTATVDLLHAVAGGKVCLIRTDRERPSHGTSSAGATGAAALR